MRRNRHAFLAALLGCGVLSLFPTHDARADLTGKTLKPVVGMKFGVESALGSLLGGTITGEVSQADVRREEPTRIVVTLSYTGFEGGKIWAEATTSDRKTPKWLRSATPEKIESTPGEVELTLELDPNAPDGALIKTSYLKVCVARADKSTPAYVKAFEMPKTWERGVRAENVLVTVTPKPIGTTATLGATPGTTAPLPPKVIRPGVVTALPARTITLQPRTATITQPAPATPAPATSTTAPMVARPIDRATTRQIAGTTPTATARTTTAATSPAAIRLMTPNTAVETKAEPAAKMLPATQAIRLNRYAFGVGKADQDKGAKGPGDTPIEPMGELRAEDIELDPSHVLGVFPSFFPDQNAASGIYYFLPYSYSLRWTPEAGYDLRMIYSATGAEGSGEVAMAARLDAGLGIRERQIASDLVQAYARAHSLPFTALRALPIDSISVSIADDLRRYSIPGDKIAVTGLSDFLGQIDVSWITDPVTKENLQQALIEDVGISGRVTLYPSGGKLAPVDVPLQIRIADFVTFGGFRWSRAETWTNPTPYPIKLKYLNALVLDSSSRPIVYSWDLASAKVPPTGRAQWVAGGVPGWIDSQAKRIWLEYAVEANCATCDETVIRSITGGVSSSGPSSITFHTITPIADAGAHEITALVRSKYFDPQSREVQTKTVVLTGDGKDFTVGPIYLGGRQPGESVPGDPLFEYLLTVTKSDGSETRAAQWITGNDLRQSIGRHQLEVAGAMPPK